MSMIAKNSSLRLSRDTGLKAERQKSMITNKVIYNLVE